MGTITTHLWTGGSGVLSADNIANPVFNSNSDADVELFYQLLTITVVLLPIQ